MPTPATVEDFQRIIDNQTKVLDDKFNSQLGLLRADVSSVRDSVQGIAIDIADLKQRTLSLEKTCQKLSDKNEDLAETVEDLQEDL